MTALCIPQTFTSPSTWIGREGPSAVRRIGFPRQPRSWCSAPCWADDNSLTALADRFAVAVMSMSRALDEQEALDLAEPYRVGRQRRLRFASVGHDLWQAAEQRLQSPVRKLRLVRDSHWENDWPLAGESALAYETMLGDPRIERDGGAAQVTTLRASRGRTPRSDVSAKEMK